MPRVRFTFHRMPAGNRVPVRPGETIEQAIKRRARYFTWHPGDLVLLPPKPPPTPPPKQR